VALMVVVAFAIALIAGGAVALATTIEAPTPTCFVDQFQGINQEAGAGSTSQVYTVDGHSVTVTFTWSADKKLWVSISGGTFASLLVKAGNTTWNFSWPYPGGVGVGPLQTELNPGGNGNALSHLNFCLWPPVDEATTTTVAQTTTTGLVTTTTCLVTTTTGLVTTTTGLVTTTTGLVTTTTKPQVTTTTKLVTTTTKAQATTTTTLGTYNSDADGIDGGPKAFAWLAIGLGTTLLVGAGTGVVATRKR
jgi:hypothetical protein